MDNRKRSLEIGQGFKKVHGNTGKKHSEETKKKISTFRKGKTLVDLFGKKKAKEIRIKMSKIIPWNKDKKHSKEIRRKISQSNKGKKSWNEGLTKDTDKSLMSISKKRMGKNNPMWKGGKIITQHGYVLILFPNHPFSNSGGYILEHRLVMEKHLGRYLKPKEQTHHINGIKDDNRIENLMLFSNRKEHIKFHHKQESPLKKYKKEFHGEEI